MAQTTPPTADLVCFTIGRTSIAIQSPLSEPAIAIPEAFKAFVTTAPPDIQIHLKLGRVNLAGMELVFESPPIWTLFRHQNRKVFSIFNQLPQCAHTFSFGQGPATPEIHFPAEFKAPVDPYCGPALELLTIEHLATGAGCLLHGCGIRLADQGLLFAGQSGAGKSTMLQLFSGEKDARILSDDRTIAEHLGDEIHIFGTPWHGKARGGLPESAKLAGIFFLKHGRSNAMRRIGTTTVVRNLLTCSFPPLWDARGMAATLEFFYTIGRQTPCYVLEFVPDRRVVDYLLRWLKEVSYA